MADEKKAFSWDEEDKRQAANPASSKSGFTWGTEDVAAPATAAKPASPQPNAIQRLSEVTLGTQHPVDELKREAKDAYAHPGEALKSVGEMAGVPRNVWSDPSVQNLSQIGGTGIPGMVFGEHGLLKHPIEFGENITGANQASEDIKNKNYKALPGDIAGGVINLATAKKPIEAGGSALAETAKNAKTGIAEAVRTPENKLTPIANAGARVGAAAAGHMMGLPGGEIAGVFSGHSLADSLLPKREIRTTPFGAYEDPEPKPVYPGAHLPDIGEHYEHRGAEINKIRSMNEVLDRRNAREAKTAATAPGAEPPAAAGEPGLPKAQVVKLPVPREPVAGENPGNMGSIPRARLLDLARQGRPGAGEQLRNIGKTPLYLPESGYAPPKSVESLEHVGGSRVTLNPVGKTGARPLAANQFESSFGPEYKEVGDLAEWETGNREGLRPRKVLVP